MMPRQNPYCPLARSAKLGAESIILSAPLIDSMILSAHTESIILSALPTESMILSAVHESIILLAPASESMMLSAL
jgi:hypothetical protein